MSRVCLKRWGLLPRIAAAGAYGALGHRLCRAALRHSPDDPNQLFGTFRHVPAEEYFAPDNLARILGSVRAGA